MQLEDNYVEMVIGLTSTNKIYKLECQKRWSTLGKKDKGKLATNTVLIVGKRG